MGLRRRLILSESVSFARVDHGHNVSFGTTSGHASPWAFRFVGSIVNDLRKGGLGVVFSRNGGDPSWIADTILPGAGDGV